MREMFRTMFSAFTSFFRAFDFGARTLENYAEWAEGESNSFKVDAAIERDARTNKLLASVEDDSDKAPLAA